jgi:alkylation response protein AidB-like acyl-CoA dehydrogenase
LLGIVQELAPVIREYADRGEQQWHLADPVVEALQNASLYHMLVPRELGGLQVDPLTFYQVIEALARLDGSTGWCMFINGGAPISAAFVHSARAWPHEVITKVWEKTQRGESASFEERAEFLLAATNATRSAAAAVELVYTAGGGSANYRRSPLQRQMRDMHAVTQHIGTAPVQYETSGRMLLGLPPETPAILL